MAGGYNSSPMTSPVISVEHLTKQYDLGVIGTGTLTRDLNRWWARVRKQPDPYTRIGQPDAFARIGESILALDDVSFTVQQGEALGIIGRNGAGKSTLLKILSRVTAPTSGVVKVRGRIGSLLEVGTGFHPELTGRENVYLNGAILGMKKAEITRRFDEIVDFAGVEKFIDTPVKRYSSGMYVRLAFAVAAHLDPEILIVDEVLAVGDAEFQKKCLGKMGDVAGEGRTVLFVSHNMGAIKQLCSSAIVLNSGYLSFMGDVLESVNHYINSFEKTTEVKAFNRTGSGKVVLDTIQIVDDENRICDNISMGDICSLELSGKSKNAFEKFSVSIHVNNSYGDPVLYYYDQFRSVSTNNTSKFSLKIGLGEIYLLPGKYSISIWLGKPGVEEFDFVKNVSEFVVLQSEKVPITDTLSQKYGYVYKNYQIEEI